MQQRWKKEQRLLCVGCHMVLLKTSMTPAACSASHVKPSRPIIVSFIDRKSHQEACVLAFIAEHSLFTPIHSLTMAPHLIKFAQEFTRDPKVTNAMSMERTTASYKLREGVGSVLQKRLVADLQRYPFSMNIDECTSSSHLKVCSVLINYYSDEAGECVTKHYHSSSMNRVNAKSLHKCIDDLFVADEISRSNVISMLSDSANYMRGKIGGI
ncbi:hypothetical protein NHX12_002549 [Muraenolepis orangiensis]|uniref:DUF4371 domain-containing protein n=1 Tax=Muraenolepis orangiensis TaxID=630683 RepID=A0A9Q0IFD4_9TELE|nr:hypothetical protein NHX12_002549 [Muraenolepis orangiensis]